MHALVAARPLALVCQAGHGVRRRLGRQLKLVVVVALIGRSGECRAVSASGKCRAGGHARTRQHPNPTTPLAIASLQLRCADERKRAASQHR